jgi:hypothetical protein
MHVNYSLKTPIEFGGKTYTDLTFREPKTGDMMVLDKFTGEMSKMVALIATIADVPIQVIKDASLKDFTAISEAVAPLLGNDPESTGAGSI